MNSMKKFDLPCMDNRKSFYGKAVVTEYPTGDKVLTSYDTEVATITAAGEFIRHWAGYSATTMRHVNSFLEFYGVDGGGVAWWRDQPISPFDWVKALWGNVEPAQAVNM